MTKIQPRWDTIFRKPPCAPCPVDTWDSPEVSDRLARRIAHGYNNETVWQEGSEGSLSVEMTGDSMCVVNWARGIWEC
eukprot:3046428-Pyramimonas_sp.AAC.1